METLTPSQVHAIAIELCNADYHKEGQEFFDSRIKRLEDAGWKLGIKAFSTKHFRGKRGHLLRKPRNEWRNICHFHNAATGVRVFYWNNWASSKAEAVNRAKDCPPPSGAFITHYEPTTH